MKLIKGLYLTRGGNLIQLKDIKFYEDLRNKFYIVTYENETGSFPRVYISDDVASVLTRIDNYVEAGPFRTVMIQHNEFDLKA